MIGRFTYRYDVSVEVGYDGRFYSWPENMFENGEGTETGSFESPRFPGKCSYPVVPPDDFTRLVSRRSRTKPYPNGTLMSPAKRARDEVY